MKYQLFGHTGLRVSDLCLGTMGFGTEWGWGADEATSKAVFDVYANAGGNFIDTANRYTEGTSEKFIGKFIEADRDHFVIATKYGLKDRNGDPNFSGNHRKNMMRSVQESLKRLNTDYIDLLWLHIWDFTTPLDEVLMGMNDLIHRGMVQYIGCAPSQVAVQWTRQRNQKVIPIIGSTKPQQFEEVLGSVSIQIPNECMEKLNAVSAIELGFPHDFFLEPGVIDVTYGQTRDQLII
jgi:aryl-alcohol dehydrogenase-like predicted oxidoreductase